MELPTLWPEGLDITPQRYGAADLPTAPAYTLEPTSNSGLGYPSASPLRINDPRLVQEY